MSDEEANEKPFLVEIAKQGRAVCKKCKQKCNQNELRIAKLMPNPFGTGKMKAWHHLTCLFETFLKQRSTTKRIESPAEDIDGWEPLAVEHKDAIRDQIAETNQFFETKFGITPKRSPKLPKEPKLSPKKVKNLHRDNSFKEFRRLVANITNVSSYLSKTELVSQMFSKGSDGASFKGDEVLWCRLLLPGFVKRVYNLQSKQLTKLFSKLFETDHDAMLEHLEQGDVSETIYEFFENNDCIRPAKNSKLMLNEVDDWLEKLSKMTKEEEQLDHFRKIAKKCTGNDLKTLIRLIKHDLRMNAGAKHILEGVHPDAYQAYQASRDLELVVSRCLGREGGGESKKEIQLMTPVLPMLAEACKSVEQAMKKCPNGMYSEIKYDGERVQVHKKGTEFRYYSRSLKPVMPHKVAHFKNHIPNAFPTGNDLVLDSEILMIDTKTGKPLPFGTLGVHKKAEFKNASVCLFIFDCIYFNGEILTNKPLKHRKRILKQNMTEIPNHIVFSEMQEIHDRNELSEMIAKVLKLGLEGLVLKDLKSVYEPGKRHWLKVKKDYLFGGAMADSADLIVLGAWYGTGKKGGMMSVFLMGCYDEATDKFCTVTKVHTGHDDKTLERLQDELEMVKIGGDFGKVPNWLRCTKTMVPDLVAKEPREQQVWEITGAEFTQHDVHTADGISIRFPRVTKIRADKGWASATSLTELRQLYKTSKEATDVSLLLRDDGPSSSKKMKREEVNVKRVDLCNELASFFDGVRVCLADEVRVNEWDLMRTFVGYGGVVVSDERSCDFEYFIHRENVVKVDDFRGDSVSDVKVKHVTLEWIKKCILEKAVCDYLPFIVFLQN